MDSSGLQTTCSLESQSVPVVLCMPGLTIKYSVLSDMLQSENITSPALQNILFDSIIARYRFTTHAMVIRIG